MRRRTVVSVWTPLRRATVLGLLLSLPAFFIHEELNTINKWTELPEWAWMLVASVLIYVISRTHERATELADWLFDRDFRAAERRLGEARHAISEAKSVAEIERLLVAEPLKALRLVSAAVFREDGGVFRRQESAGWSEGLVEELRYGEPPLPEWPPEAPFALRLPRDAAGWPDDLARPALAVPIGNAPAVASPSRSIAPTRPGPPSTARSANSSQAWRAKPTAPTQRSSARPCASASRGSSTFSAPPRSAREAGRRASPHFRAPCREKPCATSFAARSTAAAR